MKKLSGLLAFVAFSAAVLLTGVPATAQQDNPPRGSGNGLKIAPVRSDLTIEKGKTKTVSLFVENVTAAPITLRAIYNDFIPSDDESGEPRIIIDDKQSAPANSFKELVGPIEPITLQPNERKEITATVKVPADAESGGYYGAIRFAPDNGRGDENVSLTASAGTIFLVRVPGDINEKLSVESFGVSQDGDGKLASLFNGGPVSVETRFRNMGNVHVQPFGKVIVKNMSGKTIQETEINNTQPRGAVLPDSIRRFTIPVTEKNMLGKYTAEASFGYGSEGQLITAKKTFYVIPYKLIGGIAILLLFLIFGLPRIIKKYNQSVIKKSKQ